MNSRTYAVIYEQGENGSWSAYVPDLPGCVAAAASLQRVKRLMREAIPFHIEGMQLHGETVPEPTTVAGKVSA